MKESNSKSKDLDKNLAKRIDKILLEHNNDSTDLIGMLLDIQSIIERHYIPEEIAYYVAEKLTMPITQVYDVISFFSSLSEKPRAQYPIQVCDSIVCRINENKFVLDTLYEILGINLNEVTYDGRFTIEKVSCFGACNIAPAARINGRVYGRLTSKEKIEEMLNSLD